MDILSYMLAAAIFGFLIGKGYGPAMVKLGMLPLKLAFRR